MSLLIEGVPFSFTNNFSNTDALTEKSMKSSGCTCLDVAVCWDETIKITWSRGQNSSNSRKGTLHGFYDLFGKKRNCIWQVIGKEAKYSMRECIKD